MADIVFQDAEHCSASTGRMRLEVVLDRSSDLIQVARSSERCDPMPQGRFGRFGQQFALRDRKSTRLNSSHVRISYAVFCLKKKTYPTLYCIKSVSQLHD